MSRLVPFCFGIVGGLGISQNFNHKVIWGNKTDVIFAISRPVSIKKECEIHEMISKIDK